MMNDLESLRSVWQRQSTEPAASTVDQLLLQLQARTRKDFRILIAKTGAVLILTINSSTMVLRYYQQNLPVTAGILCLLAGTLLFLAAYWRIVPRPESLSPTVEPSAFVNEAFERIRLIPRRFQTIYWGLFAFYFAGLNLLILGAIHSNATARPFHHVVASTILIAAFALGRRIFQRRYQRDYAPLLPGLSNFLHPGK